MEQLNNTQKVLSLYLTQNKDKWVKREQILNDLQEFYPITEQEREKGIYYTTSAKHLSNDISALNDSEEFAYIILSNSSKGIKIANEEEVMKALLNDKINILKRLKRFWNKYNKAKENNQIAYGEFEELKVIHRFIEDKGE